VAAVNKKLDAVSKSKQAYVVAKTTMEARLREQIRVELSNIQTQIDIAVRYAFDSGESKADILRALGTKDYNTLNMCLARTSGVAEIVGVNPLDRIYGLVDGVVTVAYDRHGPHGYSGSAMFAVKVLDDRSRLFLSETPLWSDDYKVRNDVVAVLDGVKDGFYYEELCGWLDNV
jgi:hypothetical protein